MAFRASGSGWAEWAFANQSLRNQRIGHPFFTTVTAKYLPTQIIVASAGPYFLLLYFVMPCIFRFVN
jgi:hypothetical protein